MDITRQGVVDRRTGERPLATSPVLDKMRVEAAAKSVGKIGSRAGHAQLSDPGRCTFSILDSERIGRVRRALVGLNGDTIGKGGLVGAAGLPRCEDKAAIRAIGHSPSRSGGHHHTDVDSVPTAVLSINSKSAKERADALA